MTRPDRNALKEHFKEREHETLKRHPNAETLLSEVLDAPTLEQHLQIALMLPKHSDKSV